MTKMAKGRSLELLLLVISLMSMATSVSLMAQNGEHRNIKKERRPQYPEVARKMNIRGTVKIEVTISPEGKVKSLRVVGGHPLLAEAALQAATQWEFESGPKATSQVIEFSFDNVEK
jgi:TonB family protein